MLDRILNNPSFSETARFTYKKEFVELLLQLGIIGGNEKHISTETAKIIIILDTVPKFGFSTIPKLYQAMLPLGEIIRCSQVSFVDLILAVEILMAYGFSEEIAGSRLRNIIQIIQNHNNCCELLLNNRTEILSEGLTNTPTKQDLFAILVKIKNSLDRMDNLSLKQDSLIQIFGYENTPTILTLLDHLDTYSNYSAIVNIELETRLKELERLLNDTVLDNSEELLINILGK